MNSPRIALLLLTAVLMAPLLAWRYGWRGGFIVMVPPTLAVVLTPFLMALVGEDFTFFSALALVLVLRLPVPVQARGRSVGAMLRVRLTHHSVAPLVPVGSQAGPRHRAIANWDSNTVLTHHAKF